MDGTFVRKLEAKIIIKRLQDNFDRRFSDKRSGIYAGTSSETESYNE